MLAVTLLVLGSFVVAHVAGMAAAILSNDLGMYPIGAIAGFAVTFFSGGWFFGVG